MMHSFFIRIPNFLLRLNIANVFAFELQIILRLYLSAKSVQLPKNPRNIFKCLQMSYFQIW